MIERDLSGIWFTGERERNISVAFALAVSDREERTHTQRNIELSVAHMLWLLLIKNMNKIRNITIANIKINNIN